MKIQYEKYALFEGLDQTTLSTIDKASTIHQYLKGTYIHLEDDESANLELIIEGRCHVEQIDEEGNNKIIKNFGPGDYLGLNILYATNNRYMMYILTDTPVVIVRFTKKSITELLEIKAFRDVFIKLLSDHTIFFGQSMKSEYKKSLRQKLINYINTNLEGKFSNHFELKISKTRLAKELGVERTSLSRELQKMKNDGLIDYHQKDIISFM